MYCINVFFSAQLGLHRLDCPVRAIRLIETYVGLLDPNNSFLGMCKSDCPARTLGLIDVSA